MQVDEELSDLHSGMHVDEFLIDLHTGQPLTQSDYTRSCINP